jgi:hypothetical protein
MRVSKDPLEPLRCWKELFLGERTFKSRKGSATQRRFVVNDSRWPISGSRGN